MKRLIPALVIAIALSGCAARPIHPGTANKFDSTVYDTLLTTHKVIEDTKAEIDANSFSADILVKVKAALNLLITVYNDADTFYCNPPAGAGPTDSCAASSYHALAQAGQTTAASDATMQSKISTVNTAVTSLATSKGGSK
jgi:hypothetical protein